MKNNPKAEMPSAQHEHPQGRDPLCLICRLEKPFRMPEEIVQALYERKLVLFAGAGISSESRQAFPYSLVDTIKSRLGISASEKTSFPKLMSRYCSPPRGRRALYQVVKERLDS